VLHYRKKKIPGSEISYFANTRTYTIIESYKREKARVIKMLIKVRHIAFHDGNEFIASYSSCPFRDTENQLEFYCYLFLFFPINFRLSYDVILCHLNCVNDA